MAKMPLPCVGCKLYFQGQKNGKKGVAMKKSELSGMEILEQIMAGKLPPPSMATTMQMKLVRVAKGLAVFEARAGDTHLNPMGGVHGGFAATVLDSATGCAVHTLLGPGDSYGTVDLNVKMLKPVPAGAVLRAEARIIHCSRRLGVADAFLKDDQGCVYAHGTASCLISRVKNTRVAADRTDRSVGYGRLVGAPKLKGGKSIRI